jgi:flagellar assembly protein FliH
MSSSNSALVRADGGGPRPAPSRIRVLRGVSLNRGASPLEAELPGRAPEVDSTATAEVQRGYDDGYKVGVAEGLAAGRAAATAESAAVVARLATLAGALADAADDLRRRQAMALEGLEDALAHTAVDLAAAIIGRELEVAVSPGADALARALALVPAGSTAIARLHPADAARLGDTGGNAAPRGGAPAALTIIPDPVIEPGGCILEVGDSRIDAQLGSALDRVRSALLGDR